jgi:hypothetical protein
MMEGQRVCKLTGACGVGKQVAENLALADHVLACAHANSFLLPQVVLALWKMIRTYHPQEGTLQAGIDEWEKESEQHSGHVHPYQRAPPAKSHDLASLELVDLEARHFPYCLLGSAVVLSCLRGCNVMQLDSKKGAGLKEKKRAQLCADTGLIKARTLDPRVP